MRCGMIAIIILAGSAMPAWSQSPAKDRHGDPLPPGAVARLGTAAFHHDAGILGVALSSDKKLLAVTCNNSLLAIWDVPGRKMLKQFKIADLFPRAYYLTFSADGRYLAVMAEEEKKHAQARIFDWSAESEVTPLLDKKPLSVAFAPDGRSVAVALHDADGAIVLWDLQAKQEVRRLSGEENGNRFAKVVFRDDGKSLLGMTQRGDVIAWDLQPEKARRSPTKAQAVDLSRNGVWARHGNPYYFMQIDDIATSAKQLYLDKAGGHFWFGQDHDTLIQLVRGEIQLWNIKTKKQTASIAISNDVYPKIDLSADGKLLAVATEHQVRLYDLTLPEAERERGWNDHALDALAFSPDGKQLAGSSQWGSRVVLWDVTTVKPARPPQRHYHPTSLRFSGDGAELWFTVGANRLTEDCKTFKITTAKPDDRAIAQRSRDGKTLIRYPYRASVRSVPDDAPVQARTKVEVLDAATEKVVRTLELDGHFVEVSADGRTVLSARGGLSGGFATSRGPTVMAVGAWQVRDVATGKHRCEIAGRAPPPEPKKGLEEFMPMSAPRAPTLLAYSPDGRRVAMWDAHHQVVVADLHTGARVGIITPRTYGTVAFSPDGKTLACATLDKELLLCEVASGQLRAKLGGHGELITSLAFSADGALLASAARDATILLWDPFAVRATKTKARLTDADLVTAWSMFGEPLSSVKAHELALELRRHPDQTVAWLRDRLDAYAKEAPLQDIAASIKALDSDLFATRQQGEKKLKQLGALALPALTRALEEPHALESRRRIEKLLQELDTAPTGAWLQAYRGLELLERISTREAREALEVLGRGDGVNPVAIEARLCAERLKRS
jgi:WD40 repeat protein